jgi:hypothetical protein
MGVSDSVSKPTPETNSAVKRDGIAAQYSHSQIDLPHSPSDSSGVPIPKIREPAA